MLTDPRAAALVENFAGQWLYLRNLGNTHPDPPTFPDFDDNLRRALQRETELFFESIMHEDRSVLDLLTADYTFVNERLARHYGMRGIYGDRFRRVAVTDEARRGLAGPRQRADGHLLCDADVAGAAREVDSREPGSARRRRHRRRTCRTWRTRAAQRDCPSGSD